MDDSRTRADRGSGLPSPWSARYLPRMDFCVLGPMEVAGADGSVPLGGPKQRAVLAHLLLRANQVVSIDALIDGLWNEEPPESARGTIQAYVHNLRRALGPSRIESHSPGYVLRVGADEFDARRFEVLLHDAQRLREEPWRAAEVLREALALWRGPAFADLDGRLGSLQGEIARLGELRLRAIEDRIGFELAAGRHAEVLGELESLVHEHPLRERLWGHLMLARYRAGRQGDALAVFDAARRILAEELGIDPSPELQRLQEQILRQDPSLELRGEPLRGYRLLERIGDGAFGVVYRAIQPQVGREVAIKSIHRDLANDPGFIRRFEREAQLVARLEHPHVVPLHDYWRDADGAFLVMRFLRGGSLRQRIERKGGLAAQETSSILDQIAEALSAAHRQGIVHGDVKPENVLLDEEGNAYLSDFGIAKETSDSHATGSAAIAKLGYLSPEQIDGRPVTPSTDVYGLGLLVYESLAGRHPFPDGSIEDLLQGNLHDRPPSLRVERPELSLAIDGVIATATSKDPADRYADGGALAAAFREALGEEEAEVPSPPLIEAAYNPYKGLRPFDEPDAPDFFGREALVERLVARLSGEADSSRFLGVVGPSGSGKSSVVRAGLVPALRGGAFPGSETWFYIAMTPGARPFEKLEAALRRIAVDPPISLLDQLENDEEGLLRTAKRVLPADGSELLLVIDQFEELFTRVEDEQDRARFMASLVSAAMDPGSTVRIVVTLRGDFYDRPLAYEAFGELLGARTQTVGPLSPRELERAIAGPAERVGVTPEPALVAEVVADAADRPGALPLLQFALTEVFERRRDRGRLTLADYQAVGGLGGALAGRAEHLYEGGDEGHRETIRQMFLHIVDIGDAVEALPRRVRRSELGAMEVDPGAIAAAIDEFENHRLLTFDRDPMTREPTVEVAHEALLRSWERLMRWIETARDDLKTERRLAAEAAGWEEGGHDPSYLLRGSRLEQFESWAAETDVALASSEREYLTASLDQRERERRAEETRHEREAFLKRRSVVRLRALVAVLTVGALVAASLAVVARDRGRQAEREAGIATARELAAASVSNLDVDSERSLLLALEAVETTYRIDGTALPEAEEALHRALQSDRLVLTEPGYEAWFSVDGTRLLAVGATERHVGPTPIRIYDAETAKVISTNEVSGGGRFGGGTFAFSSDGRLFASADWTDTGDVYVYDARTGEQLRHFSVGDGNLSSPAFSPDDRLVAARSDRSVFVWDLKTGKLANRFHGTSADRSGSLAFSPDGKRLMIVDALGAPVTPVVVDALGSSGRSHVVSLRPPGEAFVPDAEAWSPNGALVAASSPEEVIVWDARTGEPVTTLFPPRGRFTATALALGPGSRIATGLSDGTAIVWQLSEGGGEPLLTLAGHGSGINTVSFDPDGSRLMTSSDDGRMKVWDITPDAGREWLSVRGSVSTDFSSDGRLLAAGRTTGDILIYDSATGKKLGVLSGHRDQVNALDFDPHGGALASASNDGTARVWDVISGAELARVDRDQLVGRFEEVWDIAFSPDGSVVATGSFAGSSTHLWDPTSGELVRTLPDDLEDAAWPRSVEFTRDGALVAGEEFSSVYVWNVESGRLQANIDQRQVNALAFSRDGRRLVTGSVDGRLRSWDAQSGRLMESASGNLGEVIDLAFSPDGTTLATSSSDGTVRLWGGLTLEPIMTIATDAQGKLAFSPDGARLAYAAEDEMVRVLALRTEDLIELAEARLTRSWTKDECRTYLHAERCPATVM
jgi:WD40 repeat protein/serine/threonine protein kinase